MNHRAWTCAALGLLCLSACSEDEAPRELPPLARKAPPPGPQGALAPPKPAAAPMPAPLPPPPAVEPEPELPLDTAKVPCPDAWQKGLARLEVADMQGLGVVVAQRNGQVVLAVPQPLLDACAKHADAVSATFGSAPPTRGARVLLQDADVGLVAVTAPAIAPTAPPISKEHKTTLKRGDPLTAVWPDRPLQCLNGRYVWQARGSEGYVGSVVMHLGLKPTGALPIFEPLHGTFMGFLSAGVPSDAVGQVLASRAAPGDLQLNDVSWLPAAARPEEGLFGVRSAKQGARCRVAVDWEPINLEGQIVELAIAVAPSKGPGAPAWPSLPGGAPIGPLRANAKPRVGPVHLAADAPCDGFLQLVLKTQSGTRLSRLLRLPLGPFAGQETGDLFLDTPAPPRATKLQGKPCTQRALPPLDPHKVYFAHNGSPGCGRRLSVAPLDHLDDVVCLDLHRDDEPLAVLPDGSLAYHARARSMFRSSERVWVERPDPLVAEGDTCRRADGTDTQSNDELLWTPCAPGAGRFVSQVLLTAQGPIAKCGNAAAMAGIPVDTHGAELLRMNERGVQLLQTASGLGVAGPDGKLGPVTPPLPSASWAITSGSGFLVGTLDWKSHQVTESQIGPDGQRVERGVVQCHGDGADAVAEDGTIYELDHDALWLDKPGAQPQELAKANFGDSLFGGEGQAR